MGRVQHFRQVHHLVEDHEPHAQLRVVAGAAGGYVVVQLVGQRPNLGELQRVFDDGAVVVHSVVRAVPRERVHPLVGGRDEEGRAPDDAPLDLRLPRKRRHHRRGDAPAPFLARRFRGRRLRCQRGLPASTSTTATATIHFFRLMGGGSTVAEFFVHHNRLESVQTHGFFHRHVFVDHGVEKQRCGAPHVLFAPILVGYDKVLVLVGHEAIEKPHVRIVNVLELGAQHVSNVSAGVPNCAALAIFHPALPKGSVFVVVPSPEEAFVTAVGAVAVAHVDR
mmetsp:Transcript_75098/g.150960  ORF Transcript_75098/g.150960 Transcript_75098/m.150960 type:complete len:279 (-) Transcript_75098:36-872(-)